MATPKRSDEDLLAKIRTLPPDKLAEVGDRGLTHAATKLSEDAFRKVWDNPDDADYDRL